MSGGAHTGHAHGGKAFVGRSVQRLEDPALLRGRGQYADDLKLPGMVEAAFVRSPYAHAKVGEIDISAALAIPGVHAVYTARDLPAVMHGKRILLQVPNPAIAHPVTQMPLADREVCFVGEPVAVVIADTRHAAEDGCDAVEVDWEPLPAVSDCEAALRPDSPPVHSGQKDNLAARLTLAYGETDEAFKSAAHVWQERYVVHRGTGHPMECRGVVAHFEPVADRLTVWTSTQTPHNTQRALVDMLELSEEQVRVVTPDVGGGFGPKNQCYPEELVIPAVARMLGRPVKWAEDRREHFLTATQERDQVYEMAIATDADGKILGLRGRLIHDAGAHVPWGIIMPYISASTVPGPYVIPAYRMDVLVAFTNKVGTTPMRGAGRPQAVFVMERLMDLIARELSLDPAEVRQRNTIPADAMPYKMGLVYRDGAPVMYDSGDYPECQRQAEERADWAGFPARQSDARKAGRHIGIGIASYVEGTGLGPFEGARVRVLTNGRISVATGAAAAGQAHHTTLAQICADELGVDISEIDISLGDTGTMPRGAGTYASRIIVNAGSSIRLASGTLRGKLLDLAAAHFEVDVESLELDQGRVRITGEQGASISFADLAKMTSGMPGFVLPKGVSPDLEADGYFTPPQATYSNGTHVAEVEVDPETGLVTILNYVVAHDCGTVINPMLVDGQIQGGVAHGVGNALLERMIFDEDANPLTTTFADYLLPTADIVPGCDMVHLESPTPLNPLGAKGAGEGGTIPAAAAIVAAIENALAPWGVRITESPILPERIVELVQAAEPAAEKEREAT